MPIKKEPRCIEALFLWACCYTYGYPTITGGSSGKRALSAFTDRCPNVLFPDVPFFVAVAIW